jgi:hypothetical protein
MPSNFSKSFATSFDSTDIKQVDTLRRRYEKLDNHFSILATIVSSGAKQSSRNEA